MSAKVDVLAVMDRLWNRISLHNADQVALANDVAAARAAVAEVIKSGSALCDLMPGLAGGPEFDRFVAALANAGDTK